MASDVTTSTAEIPLVIPATESPPLETGDHLDQPTFHRRYERMPPGVKAELIGGVVYMPSPAKWKHGGYHSIVMGWLETYAIVTPGIEPGDNATLILGDDSEPQPDALVMMPGGGVAENEDGYLQGPPPLVVEIASSSESYGLHSKKQDYQRAGIEEYLVALLRTQEIRWLRLRDGKYEQMTPAADGTLRSAALPGLWLDAAALLRRDRVALRDALRRGLDSLEHAAFARRLGGSKSQMGPHPTPAGD